MFKWYFLMGGSTINHLKTFSKLVIDMFFVLTIVMNNDTICKPSRCYSVSHRARMIGHRWRQKY